MEIERESSTRPGADGVLMVALAGKGQSKQNV